MQPHWEYGLGEDTVQSGAGTFPCLKWGEEFQISRLQPRYRVSQTLIEIAVSHGKTVWAGKHQASVMLTAILFYNNTDDLIKKMKNSNWTFYMPR